MKKRACLIMMFSLMIMLTVNSYAQIGLGADLVSRYVWRGTDFGNSASIQPALSYTLAGLEIGAWASYALADSGSHENDLYLTYSIGDLGITITDYYYPEKMDAFNYSDEDGIHCLEASVSYSPGSFSMLAGYYFSGDPDNSMYLEAGYEFYAKDDMEASLIVGAGDGVYVEEDDKLNVVNVGITASSGPISVSYIVNPQKKTNYLIFGYSF